MVEHLENYFLHLGEINTLSSGRKMLAGKDFELAEVAGNVASKPYTLRNRDSYGPKTLLIQKKKRGGSFFTSRPSRLVLDVLNIPADAGFAVFAVVDAVGFVLAVENTHETALSRQR